MDAVATRHKHYWASRSEQILATNDTVTFQTPLDTFMSRMELPRDTSITLVTMNKIFFQSNTTNSTLFAMENILVLVVVPELADSAVIPGHELSTVLVGTPLPYRLLRFAKHTQHLTRTESKQKR